LPPPNQIKLDFVLAIECAMIRKDRAYCGEVAVSNAIPSPTARPLKIFTLDPQFLNQLGNRESVRVDYEPLEAGPVGDRLAVIDYDGSNKQYYEAVNLEDPALLMSGGLDHSEADPRFHQQMVYAVAMKTLRHFDRALGRRVQLANRRHARLRLVPHAFNGANAYYDPKLHAVLFGYFRADPDAPGRNLPSQLIFTCLSHDIIAHEVTHALIHKLRPHFLEPTNVDILAFHEGFSDLVALFQHFTYPVALRAQMRAVRGNLGAKSVLNDIATQFGEATNAGGALRSAERQPDAKLSRAISEPHARGGILLAAVFDAFKAAYAAESAPLLRLATGGTGVLPEGDLHPELVDELVKVAQRLADATLTMIIRAFDYMPPMDMTFGDFLRALVTADMDIAPEDRHGLREALIEGFRARAIYPQGVLSLAEESLAWPPATEFEGVKLELTDDVLRWFNYESADASLKTQHDRRGKREARAYDAELQQRAAMTFHAFATEHAEKLGLRSGKAYPISVRGFHPVARVSPSGRVLNEIVLRFEQEEKGDPDNPRFGGLPLRGGCTVIASVDGEIRYVIGKPLPAAGADEDDPGHERREAMAGFVAQCDLADPGSTYADPDEALRRMEARFNLRALHGETE
jgi:hypothetical protein